MTKGTKFVGQPKGFFDLKHTKAVARKLDALLNGKIVDSNGNIIGQIHYADGNTVFEMGGQSGWFFGSTIELPVAPYPTFQKQQVIHIQSSHALVTTGVQDLANPTGPVVMSRPGVWVAMQAVPAQGGATAAWNLPQWPLPTPANYDDKKNFWLFLGEQYC